MSPEVKVFSNGDEVSEFFHKNLWGKGAPTVEKFRDFLKNPVAIQPYKDCYNGLFKPILKSSNEDNNIGFFDYDLVKDPYLELGSKLLQSKSSHRGIKVGRNEKCPCASGKKYKKCCGK
ncbi:hypothetical protein CKF48_23320 (plasmid) [Cytobacillus kochii]|uniref:Preprotein translocase subunit SecA n=2 Tax=Cytobacillus kochii TaxID=859143 RepID=A0A248TPY4_9BACI|nr:hypothetical protein CKF48_23320 [Cytobacillus kochii]